MTHTNNPRMSSFLSFQGEEFSLKNVMVPKYIFDPNHTAIGHSVFFNDRRQTTNMNCGAEDAVSRPYSAPSHILAAMTRACEWLTNLPAIAAYLPVIAAKQSPPFPIKLAKTSTGPVGAAVPKPRRKMVYRPAIQKTTTQPRIGNTI
jgi:hypothetical protein